MHKLDFRSSKTFVGRAERSRPLEAFVFPRDLNRGEQKPVDGASEGNPETHQESDHGFPQSFSNSSFIASCHSGLNNSQGHGDNENGTP